MAPLSTVPKKMSVNIISSETCGQISDIFNRVTSSRSFCVENSDDSASVLSGAGLAIKSGDKWMLRGISSAGLNNLEKGSKTYIIYTDVAKFENWIKGKMDSL